MSAIVWPAPGKLNLFLHVLGRREDGYHELQTVFQFLDYGDSLAFDIHDVPEIRRQHPLAGIPENDDLSLRAARLLQAETGCRHGVTIAVEKRLPLGGGLGGGSSDAATTLVALNRLWGTGLDGAALAALGLRLGADVPVFVYGHAAWAEGVGEALQPVDLPEPWYLVVVPPCQVATAEIFAAADLTRNCTPITIRDFLDGAGENICEAVVCRLYPEVAGALDWLRRHQPAARMSGTGSAVFAAFDQEADACALLSRLPKHLEGFVARGLNVSPLQAATHGKV
jgi:4-diphosphocytidyl-2-C-methyl-D-erythritol kinase